MSVRFVKDSEISDEIVSLINEAEREITLVSPYNNSWKEERPDMLKALEEACNRRVKIVAYYSDLKETKKNWHPTTLFPNIKGIPVASLHAKIYANENTVLITSHNLTKGSLHSLEVGLLVLDTKVVQEIKDYIETLSKSLSQPRRLNKSPQLEKTPRERTKVGNLPSDFDFNTLGIAKDERLVYRDDPKITCAVLDPKSSLVSYNGKSYDLSSLTKELRGLGNWNGLRYWKYDRELLADRLRRLEI